jgi:hypothetical protein
VINEQSNGLARNGAIWTAFCFNTEAGIGWAAELLSGSWCMTVTTSAVVCSVNDDHELSAPMFVYDGSFAPSVADLTAATLSENLLNVSTSIAELMGYRHRPRKASTDRHNFCGEPLSASTVVSQTVRRLYWRKFRYLTRWACQAASAARTVTSVSRAAECLAAAE